MIIALHVLAAILAAWRLTELVTLDRISEGFRRRYPYYVWQCGRCVSVWAGGVCTLALVYGPWVNWPLALSWLVIVIQEWRFRRTHAAAVAAGVEPIAGGATDSIIDPARKIDWTVAGIPGGFQRRTTICTTLTPANTWQDIVTAVTNCPQNSVVMLSAGTYEMVGGPDPSISGNPPAPAGLEFIAQNLKTLRGAGPDKTILHFSGFFNNCFGRTGNLCMKSADAVTIGTTLKNQNPWSAGYARGSTVLTFANALTNVAVGQNIYVDQYDDNLTDNGQIWMCQTLGVCTSQGGDTTGSGVDGVGRDGHACQLQTLRVEAVNGPARKLTVSPGIYMPNFRASQSPVGYWANTLPINGFSIEDMTIDHQDTTSQNGIAIYNGYACSVRNVRSINSFRSHVLMYYSKNLEVRDCYFAHTRSPWGSQRYGIEYWSSADTKVENNIFSEIAAPMLHGAHSVGSVAAYNFAYNDRYQTNTGTNYRFMQGALYNHNPGIAFSFYEGNDTPGFSGDCIWGTNHFPTIYRNRLQGYDVQLVAGQPQKDSNTQALIQQAYSRYLNAVGNVLGWAGWHTVYQKVFGVDAAGVDGVHAVVSMGWTGGDGTIFNFQTIPWNGATFLPGDPKTGQTSFRWGNWDVVTGTSRFVAAEVPSAISPYPNPVPATQTLIPSYLYTVRPAWFNTAAGNVPFPPIGPDVSGGNVPNVGGHAYKIPARLCFETVPEASFNANTFYGAALSGISEGPAAGAAGLTGAAAGRVLGTVLTPATQKSGA